jgi:hypothetical protein
MADDGSDRLTELLEDDWEIAGYAVTMAAMGALTHHVLLKKGTQLTSILVIVNGDDEFGRNETVLSPRPPQKKGFFG